MGLVLQTYERVGARLPAYLRPDGLERVRRIADRVPDSATSHNLEFRLNGEPRVDFLTYCSSKAVSREFESLLGPKPSAVWQHNLSLLREWSSGETEVSRVPFFSLEYDAGDRFLAEEPEANLLAAIDRRHFARHYEPLRGETPESRDRGLFLFERMLPAEARERFMPCIRRLYEALPPLGAVLHAPVMMTREPVVAKPYVVLPREALNPFLQSIGWPGNVDGLDELLRTYYRAFEKSVYIDLTITDRVHSRLGLVTSQFQRQEADFSNLGWWELPKPLNHFKEELRTWDGISEEWFGSHRFWLRRWIDTKAVLHEDWVEYKGYLGFCLLEPPLFS